MPEPANGSGDARRFALTVSPADFYGNCYLRIGGAPCVRVVGVEHVRSAVPHRTRETLVAIYALVT